jgi:hypothetical protein
MKSCQGTDATDAFVTCPEPLKYSFELQNISKQVMERIQTLRGELKKTLKGTDAVFGDVAACLCLFLDLVMGVWTDNSLYVLLNKITPYLAPHSIRPAIPIHGFFTCTCFCLVAALLCSPCFAASKG